MTETMKFEFPKTNVVACKFTFKTANNTDMREVGTYDDMGRTTKNVNAMKKYYYQVPEALRDKLQVGDVVVVLCQTGYQVCEVTEVNCTTGFNNHDLAWVVDTVSLVGFIEERRKAEELERMKDAIKREKKRLEAMVTYDLIAEKNPEFGAMLKAFKDAGGSLE